MQHYKETARIAAEVLLEGNAPTLSPRKSQAKVSMGFTKMEKCMYVNICTVNEMHHSVEHVP